MKLFSNGLMIFVLSGAFLVVPGCAAKKADQRNHASGYLVAGGYSPNYESYDLDELIDYLGYLHRLPVMQRSAECKWLDRFNAIDSSLGVKTHLAFALLSTLDCGDSREAADLLELAAQSVDDEQIRGFLSYQRELAQRLFTHDFHNKKLEQKLKRWKERNQKLLIDYKACRKGLLDAKTKLEALKAIEQSLNHTEVK